MNQIQVKISLECKTPVLIVRVKCLYINYFGKKDILQNLWESLVIHLGSNFWQIWVEIGQEPSFLTPTHHALLLNLVKLPFSTWFVLQPAELSAFASKTS